MGSSKEDIHSLTLSLLLPLKMGKQSQIRQNYHEECEALVNRQVNMELYASYVYLSLATYFTREDLAMGGFADFFSKTSANEWHHGAALMKYQTMRGGRVVLQDITKPTTMEWGTPLEVLVTVLDLHKKMTDSLLELQAKAMAKVDFHLVTFVQEKFLIYYVNFFKRAGDGLGIHMIDTDIAKMTTFLFQKNAIKIVKNEDLRRDFLAVEDTANMMGTMSLDRVVV